MGVSSVTGRMAAARQSSASPDPAHARLLVRWCTAACRGLTYCCAGVTLLRSLTLAMPYPDMPGVPPAAGAAAPGSTIMPPGRRWAVASEAEMEAGHTEERHIASLFFTNSLAAGEPPAQPPATQITASSLAVSAAPARREDTLADTASCCSCQLSPAATVTFSSAWREASLHLR